MSEAPRQGTTLQPNPSWIYNDGGRKDAGYRGQTGDCVVRAIAIATGLPYKEVYDELHERAKERQKTYRGKKKSFKSPRNGVHREIYEPYLKELGWQWTPTMQVGQGCSTHLKRDELPQGTLIVKVSRHVVCVKDGTINDTYDCSRDGTRCVYGYFSRPD